MFSRQHRFHGYGSLRKVYKNGQVVRGPQISLKYYRREADKPYRVAVVVSRKVSKSAVVRNRIRRRLYETVRQAEAAVPPGTDLVFTVFNEQLKNMETSKLQSVMQKLLKSVQP